MKLILDQYERASGQQVNFSKSSMVFSKAIPQSRRDEILITLDMWEGLSHEKYLGLPTHIDRFKKKAFAPIKDRIAKRIKRWLGKNLSWAGREVLVKAVAQSIPTYAISAFRLPRDFCQEIKSMINRYWWGAKEGLKKIYWIG